MSRSRLSERGNDPAVDARIASIVADNAGPRAHEPARLSREKLERKRLEAAASGAPLGDAGR